MGLTLKGNREAAKAAVERHDRAKDDWLKSAERRNAIRDYPDEHIVARRGEVIEHSKDIEALFLAVKRRETEKGGPDGDGMREPGHCP